MTDRVDLDKLRELAEAATPGPWEYTPRVFGLPSTTIMATGDFTHVCYPAIGNALEVNATFIAAANPAVVLELLARLATAEALEVARLRDAAHPEYVPEAVTDAGFASQAHWWKPGDEPIQGVYVAQLIEQVAEAAYRATIAAQAAGEGCRE